MGDLRQALAAALAGRTCVVGVGNSDLGDDGLGPHLAGMLAERGVEDVLVAGVSPESCLGRLTSGDYDHVLFVDALDFEGQPGSTVLLAASEVRSRLPQVSTHKISLGTLAGLIERSAATSVHLLGVKPATLRPARALSAAVLETADALAGILCDVLTPGVERRSSRRPGCWMEGEVAMGEGLTQ